MKVWLVETGVYENRGISGVYATKEAAMAAHPLPSDYKFPEKPGAGDLSRPTGWYPTNPNDPENCSWDNGMDWDYSATCEPWDVEE